MDALKLRRRRRAYARRARLGFEGYRVGSAVHLFQAVLRPMHAVPFAVVAAGVAALAGAGLTALLVAGGATAVAAVTLAGGVIGGAWLLSGMARFWLEVRRARSLRPPGWPDEAGVREPRVPPPDAGELRASRFPSAPPGPTAD